MLVDEKKMMNLEYSLDIHCQVVDNYGDAGIALRLAKLYKNKFPFAIVRLFIDDIFLLSKLDSNIDVRLSEQTLGGVVFFNSNKTDMTRIAPSPIVIQLLETSLNETYQIKALNESRLIMVFEGVSAEEWVKDIHGSFSFSGERAKKTFFIPGFIKESGGICLTEANSRNKEFLIKVLLKYGFNYSNDALTGVLFHYDGELREVVSCLNNLDKTTFLFVCGEKSQQIFKKIGYENKKVKFIYVDFLKQDDFDKLLGSVDFNFIRGEDSMMQSINYCSPFVWQLYPQKDNAHLVKLRAFLNMIEDYFSDKEMFLDYEGIMNYYNGVEVMDIEGIVYSFFKNLDKIKEILEKLRKNLLKDGDLIERLAKFINQTEGSEL